MLRRSAIISSFREVVRLPLDIPRRVHKPQVNSYFFQKIDLTSSPSYNLIIPGLYLGNARAAYDGAILRQLNITHVISAQGKSLPKSVVAYAEIRTLFIKVKDSTETNIMQYFPISNAFIEEGIKYGGVLVHCHLGVSRSSTLVIAYLMDKHDMTFNDAFELVRQKRSFINPNPGFVNQLLEYENSNHEVGWCMRSNAYMKIMFRRHRCKIFTVIGVMAVGIAVIPLFYFLL